MPRYVTGLLCVDRSLHFVTTRSVQHRTPSSAVDIEVTGVSDVGTAHICLQTVCLFHASESEIVMPCLLEVCDRLSHCSLQPLKILL